MINKIIDALITSCALMLFIGILIAIWGLFVLGCKIALTGFVVGIMLNLFQDGIESSKISKN